MIDWQLSEAKQKQNCKRFDGYVGKSYAKLSIEDFLKVCST